MNVNANVRFMWYAMCCSKSAASSCRRLRDTNTTVMPPHLVWLVHPFCPRDSCQHLPHVPRSGWPCGTPACPVCLFTLVLVAHWGQLCLQLPARPAFATAAVWKWWSHDLCIRHHCCAEGTVLDGTSLPRLCKWQCTGGVWPQLWMPLLVTLEVVGEQGSGGQACAAALLVSGSWEGEELRAVAASHDSRWL